jgi:hypothetical protein
MKIGQLSFVQLTEAAESPYGTGTLGSKYQGQAGPTPSRYWKNFQAESERVPGPDAKGGGAERFFRAEPGSPETFDAEGGGGRRNFATEPDPR